MRASDLAGKVASPGAQQPEPPPVLTEHGNRREYVALIVLHDFDIPAGEEDYFRSRLAAAIRTCASRHVNGLSDGRVAKVDAGVWRADEYDTDIVGALKGGRSDDD